MKVVSSHLTLGKKKKERKIVCSRKCKALKEACLFFTWRGEEDSSKVFIVGNLEDFSCDVHQPSSHRRDPPEVQDPDKQVDEIKKKPPLDNIILSFMCKERFTVHAVHARINSM